ncbi:MAG: RNA polymerase factor sigma-54 [Bdellovibrionaceae bacterium]|nr:RNA polymerase factor sigma-54 [Pseudobdellovibrionaceae bacterium]
MQMKQSLALKQTLKMTPQLQQAIKLLQLSRMELEAEIRKEMNENPILEESAEDVARETQSEHEIQNQEDSREESRDTDTQKQDDFEWDSFFENQNRTRERMVSRNEEISSYENIIATAQTLHDHLRWQASLYGFNEEELAICNIVIDYINDDGYIEKPLSEIAAEEEVLEKDLEEILPFIHEFDPFGVGARDLQECLLIQARHLQEDTHDFVTLIKNHIRDLERKNYHHIAKEMNLSLDEIIDMCKIINTMDPKPGRQFAVNDTYYVTPDVYIYKVGEEYVVSLNEDGLPKLRISNFYKNMSKSQANANPNDPAHSYIQDKLRSALWLIRSIHQRQRTIYKVTESIVRHQTEFFEKGAEFIKPMILRDIANDIGMHESTVSRVTTNKYVHTPQGIYELKYFFNSGISTDDGDSLASESVKMKIKDMVSNEDPKKPLSDQKIVDLLKKDGIIIARRTVAKYRDVLRILPSGKRKKMF